MHPDALATCAAFLRCGADDVLALREDADLLAALLAGIGLELRQRNSMSPADDDTGRFCQAMLTGFGTQRFTASELLKWAESGHSSDSRTALQAARAMCRVQDDSDLTVQMLGMQLARLAQIDGARLARVGEVRGAAVWQLRDLRD